MMKVRLCGSFFWSAQTRLRFQSGDTSPHSKGATS
jgi:hypothetical protein